MWGPFWGRKLLGSIDRSGTNKNPSIRSDLLSCVVLLSSTHIRLNTNRIVIRQRKPVNIKLTYVSLFFPSYMEFSQYIRTHQIYECVYEVYIVRMTSY